LRQGDIRDRRIERLHRSGDHQREGDLPAGRYRERRVSPCRAIGVRAGGGGQEAGCRRPLETGLSRHAGGGERGVITFRPAVRTSSIVAASVEDPIVMAILLFPRKQMLYRSSGKADILNMMLKNY
jgi:hypothetical protein